MRMLCLVLLALAGCSSESAAEAASSDPPAAAPEPTSQARADGPPRTVDGAAPGGVLDLEPGMIVRAKLEPGDRALVDESLGDDYGLMLDEGEVVTILIRGGASSDPAAGRLDMQGFLLFNGQDVAADDDGAVDGDARNARIVYSPPVVGFYVLRATTSGPGAQTGDYEVQVYAGGRLRQL